MDFSRHDYLTPEQILFQVLTNVGDKECKKIYLGWYHAELQFCLEELSFDTLFFENRVDVPVPHNLQHDLGKGTFNVKQIYAYNGDICAEGQMTKLWHKKNYFTAGGRVVAKNRQDGSSDPFYPQHINYSRDSSTLLLGKGSAPLSQKAHYYNIENGVVMLSPSVREFQKLHIRSSGISANLGDTPFIPQVFRSASVDFVCESACRAILAEEGDKKYQYLQQLYEKRLDKEGFRGSWHTASTRIARMSEGEKNDYREYLARWRFAK